jgi:hypothetical protein
MVRDEYSARSKFCRNISTKIATDLSAAAPGATPAPVIAFKNF